MHEDDEGKARGAASNEREAIPDTRSPLHALRPPVVPLLGEGSRAHLLSWLDVLPDALVLVDSAGRIVLVNSQAEALFGYLRPELEGLPLEVLLPERFHAAHALHRERYAASPRTRPMGASLELYGRRKDGTEFPADITLSPLLLDDTLHVLGAIRDSTERRRLQEREHAARASAEARLALLQLILDELPTGVSLVQGKEARLVLANRAATTLWGAAWRIDQPMQDFLATHHIRLFGADGHPLPPAACATLRAVQQRETVRQHLEIIRHADGTTHPVLVHAMALDRRLLSGVPTGGGSQLTDPAEPVALVVHQEVRALKDAGQLNDHFLELVAYELRAPLSALKGFVHTLLYHTARGRGATLADWQQEALAEIDLATVRLDRLTEDLFDVVRLLAGRLVPRQDPIDLVALCQRVIAQLQGSTDRHQLALSTPLSHLQAYLDGERLAYVLAKLLANAINDSPAGGPVEMALSLESERQEALISMRTQGVGIPKEAQPHLVGRLDRAATAQADELSGPGLGLSLCRELIEQQAGHLWFVSSEGASATVFIRLPLVQDASSPDVTGRPLSPEGPDADTGERRKGKNEPEEQGEQMARTNPWEVSDALWERVRPLIPKRPAHRKGGRPAEDNRQMFAAIMYVLHTGIPWNALPRELGASTTVYDRFRLWEEQGVLRRLWEAGLLQDDQLRRVGVSMAEPGWRADHRPFRR
jgi:PAS domain S-box-containing protein